MRNLIIMIFSTAVLFLCASPCGAVQNIHLYQANVSVVSTSAADRAKALPQALTQVLLKVSGNSAIATLPAIVTELVHADSFVQQYRYLRASEQNGQPLQLQVDFNSSSIVQLLHKSGQAVWSAERPLLIAWVVENNDEGRRSIYSNENHNSQAGILEQQAQLRGLPMILPTMDLQDLTNLSVSDIWHEAWARIQNASQRYGRVVIIVAKLEETNQHWHAKWSLLLEDTRLSWDMDGESRAEVIKQGIDNIADTLASRYAVLENETKSADISLVVYDVQSVADYAKVLQYLRSLAPVNDVQVAAVEDGKVSYKIKLRGSVGVLQKVVANRTILLPELTMGPQSPDALSYRFVS